MSNVGYFESVSANLKAGVGVQMKGISECVKTNSEVGVSPSVNALNTSVKSAAVLGGLAGNLCEAAVLNILGAMGMKGMACLPVSKQLDPVIGVDIHLVTILSTPVVPMPYPYVGVLLNSENLLAEAFASYLISPLQNVGHADAATLLECHIPSKRCS